MNGNEVEAEVDVVKRTTSREIITIPRNMIVGTTMIAINGECYLQGVVDITKTKVVVEWIKITPIMTTFQDGNNIAHMNGVNEVEVVEIGSAHIRVRPIVTRDECHGEDEVQAQITDMLVGALVQV